MSIVRMKRDSSDSFRQSVWKEFSKYTEQSDETHRLDYIPYAETETPSEAPQKQSSKAKSMEKTVSQSSPDVSTQEAAFSRYH